MKLTIVSSQMTGIFKALQNAGLIELSTIRWVRHPMRVKGMWHAEVMV